MNKMNSYIMIVNYLFPASTVMTESSEREPPAKRPRPLIRVESAVLQQSSTSHSNNSDIDSLREGRSQSRSDVVPISKSDNSCVWTPLSAPHVSPISKLSLTIIDIVEIRLGIVRVVNYEWSSETITVLSLKMTVIPESTCQR